jgi:hypothetical protein
MKLNDNSPMPFGKYKGQEMQKVPASYLLWLYSEWTDSRFEKANKDVKEYIEDNFDVLREEIKRDRINKS